MKATTSRLGFTLLGVLALIVSPVSGTTIVQTFGSGANTFTIPFVPVDRPGNGADATGYGAVAYTFNISTYAVSQVQIDAATALGVTNLAGGAWGGNQPAALMNWYQAAAFVNWLNTSQGYAPAYNLTYSAGSWSMALWNSAQAWQIGGQNLYRNANCAYFLPSENEYYKAAYYDSNASGGAGGYWLYATGSDTAPTAVASGTGSETAVYNGVASQPAAVNNAGGLSPAGTMGQSGNVYAWQESAYDGGNDDASENRAIRGGSYANPISALSAFVRNMFDGPSFSSNYVGFRVASVVPEPTTGLSLLLGLGVLAARRNRKTL